MDIIQLLLNGVIDHTILGVVAANPVITAALILGLRILVKHTKTTVDDELLSDVEKILPIAHEVTKTDMKETKE